MKLDEFDFYKTLNSEDRAFLEHVLKPVALPQKSILFFQGDSCQDILLLSSGELRLYLHGEESETITLYHLHKGEQCIVNTSSAISSSPAIATAEALTDIEGWLLPREHVKTLMLRSDTYKEFIFSLFALKLSSLAEVIEDIKFTKLEDRLIKLLKRNQPKVELTTTHEALAVELGSSRVVISRLLKKLEAQEKIVLHRGKIEIKRL
jgi:CRP/FNR family transcriptional regulator